MTTSSGAQVESYYPSNHTPAEPILKGTTRHLNFFSTTIVITIAAVISAVALWPGQATATKKAMAFKQEVNKQETAMRFDEVSSKKGSTKDGAPFASQLYRSSDGAELTVTRENRDTADRANKAMHRRLKGAIRIVERGPKLDAKGQRVGKRVVAMFALDKTQKEQASVLWTYDRQFYYLESISLKHVLEFEKQFYH